MKQTYNYNDSVLYECTRDFVPRVGDGVVFNDIDYRVSVVVYLVVPDSVCIYLTTIRLR